MSVHWEGEGRGERKLRGIQGGGGEGRVKAGAGGKAEVQARRSSVCSVLLADNMVVRF